VVGVVTVSATEQVAAVMVATGGIFTAAEIDLSYSPGGANVTPIYTQPTCFFCPPPYSIWRSVQPIWQFAVLAVVTDTQTNRP